jgi:hypothetical protein
MRDSVTLRRIIVDGIFVAECYLSFAEVRKCFPDGQKS